MLDQIHQMRARSDPGRSTASTELRPDGIHSSDAEPRRSQQRNHDRDKAAITSTVTVDVYRPGLSAQIVVEWF